MYHLYDYETDTLVKQSTEPESGICLIFYSDGQVSVWVRCPNCLSSNTSHVDDQIEGDVVFATYCCEDCEEFIEGEYRVERPEDGTR